MATSSFTMPVTAKSLGLRLEVRITGLQKLKVRGWLGAQLLRLAAWVIGLELEVTLAGGPQGPAARPSLSIPPARLAVSDLERADRPVTWAEATRILVMLDGAEVKDVVAYDAEAGWIERWKRDSKRELVVQDGKLAVERITGAVTVQFREAA